MADSRLQQIVSGIANLVDIARDQQGQPVVTWVYGHRKLRAEAILPRVVWHRTTDRIEAPDQTRPDRSRRTCNAGLVFHVFGADDEQVETIRDQIINYADEYTGASLTFDQDVDWDLPEWLTIGEKCALYARFEQPVRGIPEDTVEPNAADLESTDAIAGDAILTAAEPT